MDKNEMSKFKVGNRIRYIKKYTGMPRYGAGGTVIYIEEDGTVGVIFDESFGKGWDLDGRSEIGHGREFSMKYIEEDHITCIESAYNWIKMK